MISRQIEKSHSCLACLVFLLGALTGCPLLFNADQAGKVSFSASPDNGVAPLAVSFYGTANLYPSYEPVSWTWAFGDGATGDGQQISHTYAAPGAYTVTLQVAVAAKKFRGQDDQPPTVLESSRVVTVQAGVTNNPPVANAGPDQNVVRGAAVTLDGSGSSDPDGDTITYAWSFVSRPAGSAAALTGATTVSPTFAPDRIGDFVVRLIVNDGALDSAADTVTITVGNRIPVANAGPDQGVTTGAAVVLDGSASSDADGDALTYAWTFVARPTGSAASLTGATTVAPGFTPDLDGSYVIQLIVNDGHANSAPDTVTVTASTANTAPTAVALVQSNGQPTADVFANIEAPERVPDLDTLYGLDSEYQFLPDKQYGPPFYLYQIDPDDASILDGTQIRMFLDLGGYLYPISITIGKGLAMDPTNGDLWAILGFNDSSMVGKQYAQYYALAKIDLNTGIAEAVGDPIEASLPQLYCDLGIDDSGLIYGATDNIVPSKVVDTPHALYEIDRGDTSDTFVIQFPELGDIYLSPGEVVAFNTDDGLMYHATGGEETQADRMFRALNLDTLALTNITLQNDHASWMYPTAMAYAPGTNQFYLAEPSEGQALYRITLSGTTSTEELVGLIPLGTPLAGLTFLYDVTFPPPLVVLDASDSSDPEGDDLTFEWQFTSVPPGSAIDDGDLADATTATPSFTPDLKGAYVLRVRVYDGALYSDWATVTVNYLNTPPVANAGADQEAYMANYIVQLNGGGSYDPDGGALTYSWTFLSAPGTVPADTALLPSSSDPAPYFYPGTMDASVPYVLQLTVTDEDGGTDTDTVEVLVAVYAPPL